MTRGLSIFYNSFFDAGPGLNPYTNNILARFQNILPKIEWFLLSEPDWLRLELKTEVNELVELYQFSGIRNVKFIDFLNDFYEVLLLMEKAGNEVYTDLWNEVIVSEETRNVPNMLHEESYKYYKWLGKTHTGAGAIVELGCWMGATSCCVMEGLLENDRPHNKEMFVFDAFRWTETMMMFQKFKDLTKAKFEKGDSFIHFFKKYCAKYLDKIHLTECMLYTEETTYTRLPALAWNNENAVEILISDFSPSKLVNGAAWKMFSPSFIPGKTILVFNQFGNLSATELREFIRDHSIYLKPIHKPKGAIKSYLYIEPA
jgi:hypothetical protein